MALEFYTDGYKDGKVDVSIHEGRGDGRCAGSVIISRCYTTSPLSPPLVSKFVDDFVV